MSVLNIPRGVHLGVDKLPTPSPQKIAIKDISFDPSSMTRASISQTVVADYQAAITSGERMPPVILFRDSDKKLWIGDGWHQLYAWKANQTVDIKAEVYPGGRREAVLYSLYANATNGLRRSREDKKRAVAVILSDPEGFDTSDNWIANALRVSAEFVAGVRNELRVGFQAEDCDAAETEREITVARSGSTYKMTVADKKPKPAFPLTCKLVVRDENSAALVEGFFVLTESTDGNILAEQVLPETSVEVKAEPEAEPQEEGAPF